jgi:tetratricopeptide (TPR) repeat protein
MRNKAFFWPAAVLLLLLPAVLLSAGDDLSTDPMIRTQQLTAKGRYDDALKLLITVRQKFPDTDWANRSYLLSAGIYEKMKRNDDAVAEYKNIIQKFPASENAEEAYFAIARIKESQDNDSQAIKAFAQYLKNYPKGGHAVMALFDIATLFKQEGRHDDALKYFSEILRNYPDEKWFYSWSAIYSGHIYAARKNYDKAIESYQMVINSKDNTFLYTLSELHRAQAYMGKKEYATAKALFHDILKANKYFQEEALYGMGKAHYKLGEYDMAKEVYVSLLEMFPDTVWRANVEKGMKLMDKKLDKQRKEESDDDL